MARLQINIQSDGDVVRNAFANFVSSIRPIIKAKQDKDDWLAPITQQSGSFSN